MRILLKNLFLEVIRIIDILFYNKYQLSFEGISALKNDDRLGNSQKSPSNFLLYRDNNNSGNNGNRSSLGNRNPNVPNLNRNSNVGNLGRRNAPNSNANVPVRPVSNQSNANQGNHNQNNSSQGNLNLRNVPVRSLTNNPYGVRQPSNIRARPPISSVNRSPSMPNNNLNRGSQLGSGNAGRVVNPSNYVARLNSLPVQQNNVAVPTAMSVKSANNVQLQPAGIRRFSSSNPSNNQIKNNSSPNNNVGNNADDFLQVSEEDLKMFDDPNKKDVNTSGRRDSSDGRSRSTPKKKYTLENVNVKDSKYSLNKIDNLLSEKDKLILAQSKAKKILQQAELSEQSINENARELGTSYLEISSSKGGGSEGILSFKLKIVGGVILGLMLFMIIMGYYLNTSNPLIPLINSARKPFAINVVDQNNVKIFTAVNSKESINDSVSEYLIDSLLALHGSLEYRYQEEIGEKIVSQDETPLEKPDQAVAGTDANAPKEDSVVDIGTRKLKDLFKNNKCKIYTDLKDFGSYDCRYSYSNFLVHDFLRDINDNSLVSKLINRSDTFRNYLLITWIEGNVSEKDFLDIYFNYVSYGETFLGLKAASQGYFKKDPADLALPEAIYLMNLIYQNNKNLYPDFKDVGVAAIVDQLVRNRVVLAEDRDILIQQVEGIRVNQPETSFMIYMQDIYNQAMMYNLKVPAANVKTTFISSLQNAAISMLEGSMKNLKIPDASLVLLQNNKILAGVTFALKGNEVVSSDKQYFDRYADIYSYNVMKPFLYYALLKNNVDIPPELLNARYQNLLFSDFRIERKKYLEELDVKIIADGLEPPRRSSAEIEAMTNTNLDNAPAEVRLLFAKKLVALEEELLLRTTPDKYMDTLKSLFINTQITSIQDIVNGKIAINFMDLVKLYSALSVGGYVYPINYVSSINGDYLIDDYYTLANIEPKYVNIINNVMFNNYQPRGKKTTFNYIVDTNTLFAFKDGYVIAMWLGDLENPDFLEDYSTVLTSVFKDLSSVLPIN